MAAIKNKAKSLSCLGLGLIQLKQPFDMEYEYSIGQIKDCYETDAPKHIRRTAYITTSRSINSRLPG